MHIIEVILTAPKYRVGKKWLHSLTVKKEFATITMVSEIVEALQ